MHGGRGIGDDLHATMRSGWGAATCAMPPRTLYGPVGCFAGKRAALAILLHLVYRLR